MTEPAEKPGVPQRMVAVDALRGLAIIAMVLLNNPGDWGTIYWPLRHAEWHGWTPTDLVFPFFLFVVGVAIVLGLQRRIAAGVAKRTLVAKIVKRSLILLGLGLLLTGFPFGLLGPTSFSRMLDTWRFPGVLQRIAACYLVASLLFLFYRTRTLRILTVLLLVSYWALMTIVPVPGQVVPDIDSKGGHLAAWVDRAVFGSHLWESAKVYDPEGILSTIPAIATTLLGVLAGLLLASSLKPVEKVARLLVRGTLLVSCGYVWGWFFPINKSIWTSSYAVFTAGLAMCTLALCAWFCDIQNRQRLARPFVIAGMNAIAVYVGSGLLSTTLDSLQIGDSSLKQLLYEHLFASWLPPHPASLAYAVAYVTGWFLVLAWMHRRGLFLKI